MSHFFLARDVGLGRAIVVKIFPPGLALGVKARIPRDDRAKRLNDL